MDSIVIWGGWYSQILFTTNKVVVGEKATNFYNSINSSKCRKSFLTATAVACLLWKPQTRASSNF